MDSYDPARAGVPKGDSFRQPTVFGPPGASKSSSSSSVEEESSQEELSPQRKITEPIEKSLKVNSSTIAIHNGREAGQEIPHVHIHVVPRSYGDGGGPIHSLFKKNRPQVDSNMMREIVDKIRENMK